MVSDGGETETDHPLIYKAHEAFMSLAQIEDLFAEIRALAEERDTQGLKRLLMLKIPGYKPDFSAPDYSACLRARRENQESIRLFEAALQEEAEALSER